MRLIPNASDLECRAIGIERMSNKIDLIPYGIRWMVYQNMNWNNFRVIEQINNEFIKDFN